MGRWRAIEIALDGLELARGSDGALRGAPEPCLLLGAYWVRAGRAVVLGRSITRLPVLADPPVWIDHPRRLLRVPAPPAPASDGPATLVVLGLALEADSGQDVEALYATLADPGRLALWNEAAPVPEPRSVVELAGLPATQPPVAEPVRVLRDGIGLRDEVRRDDWVGSALIRVTATPGSQTEVWRFHFVSPGGDNDWTAVLRVGIG